MNNTISKNAGLNQYNAQKSNENKCSQPCKKFLAKSSSVSSLENYQIDAARPAPSVLADIANVSGKRKLSEHNLFTGVEKKTKLESSKESLKQSQINESGIGLLQSTLDCADFSMLDKKYEFDAFAHFLKTPKPSINRQLFTKNDNELIDKTSLCSQFFTTQVIKQIDTDIKAIDGTPKPKENEFKIPLIQSFNEKLKMKKSISSKVNDRSVLFENENITLEYRQEINNIFEQIEHSIFAMGDEDMELPVPAEILHMIFNDDSKAPQEENLENANLSVCWPSGNEHFDMSFSTLIKKTLIQNATKSSQQRRNIPENFNISLSERPISFCNLGPFYGLPLKVKDLIRQFKGIEELYDWQNECLELPAVKNRKNLIYALPTSGGKTLVAEILMFREIMCCKRNAILILPYVSIVQEKVWALSPFAVALDFLVEEYASSKGIYPPRKRRRKNSVYVATIEKALGIINSLIEAGRLYEVGLIIVDELHLLGEEGRGSTLEALLTKIMFLNVNIQIIGMSATIGNLLDICKFLKAEVYTQNFRPVELVEYIKCGQEIAKVNWNYLSENDLLVAVKRANFKYAESLSKVDPDMLGGLVMEIVPKGSCLIFCPSKKNCENVTNLLCKLLKPDLKEYRKTEKNQLIHSLKDETGELCNILRLSVPYGVAYHHSGLTSDERRIIEEGFRAGIISVICCTSTLAAGVNLPAQRVILRSPYVGKEFISLSKYKQMVGRAGRAGLGKTGDSVLIAQPTDLPKVKALLMSPMNNALSNMHIAEGKGLRHLLLSCISLGIANTRPELQKVASSTLLSVQKETLDIDIKKLTDQVIKNLFKLGALKESCGKEKPVALNLADISVSLNATMQDSQAVDDLSQSSSKKKKRTLIVGNSTKLVVSALGSASIKGGLELSRAHLLYEDLNHAQSCLVLQGHLHLLYLITPYDTAEQIRPNRQIYYEVFTKLQSNQLKVAKTLGLNESIAVKLLTNNPIRNVPERVLNRFYVTLMLYDLWNEMPVFQVSEKFQINRGIVQNLMTNSATFASNVINFCEQLEEFWAYKFLLKGMSQRLSHCCVKELLPLMELPAVKQSRARQLYRAGYKTLQDVAKANVDELVNNIEFMSRRVANQLIAASKMLLLEKVENLREEAEDVLDGVNTNEVSNETFR